MEKTLLDVAAGVCESEWQHTFSSGMVARKWTLRGGLSDGVDVIEVANERLRVRILPTRGMGLWNAEFLADGKPIPIGWSSPVALPVHPKFVDPQRRGGIGWLDGFNELMCRCGLMFNGPPGDDMGTPITLHGRIANLPAHCVRVREIDNGIEVEGEVDEASMFGGFLRMKSTVRMTSDAAEVVIRDTISNHGASPTDVQLLYHTNIGTPLLSAGSRFSIAHQELAPRDERAAEGMDDWQTFLAPTDGYAEQVYFAKPVADDDGEATALLHTEDEALGVSVRFAVAELPCFSLWKCTQGLADGYVAGLEPGINFPNFKTFEREHSRVASLTAGESRTVGISLALHASQREIQSVANAIAETQSGSPPIVHVTPTLPLSAG